MLALWFLGDWLKQAWGLNINVDGGDCRRCGVSLAHPGFIRGMLESQINWKPSSGGCGHVIGAAVYNSGAAAWLQSAVFGRMNLPPFPGALLLSVAVMLLKLMFSSNTATASIVMPVVLAAINGVDVGPWQFLAPASVASPRAFILVTSAPAHVVFHDSECFSVRDMARVGIPMTMIAAVCIALVCTLVLH